ncbi:MAG: sugar transferase [Candidatus Hodarchaeota archaeon]
MLYSRRLLEQRIEEERSRTYRIGSPFSVVLFNPFKLVPRGMGDKRGSINRIISALEQKTRETDIKGWWDRNTLAVILLDTFPEKVLPIVEDRVSKIRANAYGGIESTEEVHFEIFNFPNTQQLERKSRDNERGEDSGRSEKRSNHNCPKRNSLINLPDANFWDSLRGIIKRCFDIAFSIPGLIILSPFLLLCALLIKLESPGPVFYRQTRVGKGGKCFTFLKFRSMLHNTTEEIHKNHIKNLMNGVTGLSSDGRSGERSYKLTEDRRITRVGKFLRKMSIDELPQLINVLKGDMTLVGPRPHPVYEVEQYRLWHSHRLDVKPGITGFGQIYGRFNTEYEDVYRLDLRYLKRQSLILDLHILLKTIPLVLSRRGAH